MKKLHSFRDLVAIMHRLRRPGGCPWDRKQTHQSLLKYLTEESREVAQAVRRGDSENLCEELGDVLLQVLFHSEIAAEKGRFSVNDVVDGLARKLIRRHPHVFGGVKLKTAEQVAARWKEIKMQEKAIRAKNNR